jgi:hypothetical protein
MRAADLDTEVFMDAVDRAAAGRGSACWWDVAAELNLRYPGVPEKVVLAKGRKLIRRGMLGGCWCGCRGDWSRVQKPTTA